MTFEFVSAKGNKIRIEAEVKSEIAHIDYSEAGAEMPVVREEVMFTGEVEIYVDGEKKYWNNLSNPKEWKVREIIKAQEKFFKLPAGTKYITIGMTKIAFPDDETAENYADWLNNLLETNKPVEVKEVEKKQEIASLQHEIAKADRAKETGHFVATEEEAKARRKVLMDFADEENMAGFEPIVYSAEKLEKVKARLKELECA